MQDHEYYAKSRPEVVPFLPAVARRVLEVGCGEGRFRAHLTVPCEYHGIEPVHAAARAAAGVLDQVHIGSYETAEHELPDGYFDLVICNDVIEHMIDHDAFLERIRQKMAPGAHLVGSIPNVRHLPHLAQLLVGKEWHYADFGLLDRTHLRFFTRRSWERTLSEHGFVVEAVAGINGLGHTSRWTRRLARAVAIAILGDDTRFLQFGFRARMADVPSSAS